MNLRLTFVDLLSISPLLIVLGGALILLLVETFYEEFSKKGANAIALFTLLLAVGATGYAPISTNLLLTDWLRFDHLARLFTLFFLFIGLGTTLLTGSFFQRFASSQSLTSGNGEYYFLLMASVFGLILIGSSADFLTLFLGIETLSISLYVWVGYLKKWELANESSIKYLLMGALAAAFFLYGVALVYGALGTTQFDLLLERYNHIGTGFAHSLFFAGIALVTLALAFEAAIVPFQAWAPDVYEGSTTPVAAFMSVGTKVGAFAAFVRVFFDALPNFDPLWNLGISFLAYSTLIFANFVALRQTQLRRFFAYSGISHAGFLLLPLVAGTPDALTALLFYLVVYAMATFGAFAVLAFLDHQNEGVMLNDLKGLFQRSPLLAGIFTLCLLTLAGIPPTAGFFAKFYIFKVAFQAGYYTLVIFALLTTILSAYYYLRIIALIFSATPEEKKQPLPSWPAWTIGVVSFVTLLMLSFYPTPLINLLTLRL